MNDYNIPIIETSIDYTKVPAINQKRTISFINHFIVHTVTYLNKFAMLCEEKLFEFENKLQRMEASLKILESWLPAVPGVEQESQDSKEPTKSNENKEEEKTVSEIDEPDNNQDEPKDEQADVQLANKDPSFDKYLKMIHFGVPKELIKLQMMQEGLDSSILFDSQQVVSKPRSTDNGENKCH